MDHPSFEKKDDPFLSHFEGFACPFQYLITLNLATVQSPSLSQNFII